MAVGNFSKSGAGAKAAKGAAKSKVKKSKYAGIPPSEPEELFPHVGAYRLRVVSCEEGTSPKTGNDWYKAHLEIVDFDKKGEENHKKGENVCALFITSGKGGSYGLQRLKLFVMAAAGYDDHEEYDAFDPDGGFIESTTGTVNDYTDVCTIVGRVVDVQVRRGSDTDDGDYYREYEWALVPDDDDEQDTAPKAET